MEDVVGLKLAKQALTEAIIIPQRFPDSPQARNAWKGILLFGPSGTGKTQLIKAVASVAKMTFINVKIDSIITKWQGESEKNIEALFSLAHEKAPSIVFIDECDSLCRARSSNESDGSSRVKNKLLTSMDGFDNKDDELPEKRVVVIGNTNLPQSLDSAFLRRFPKRVFVNLPSVADRFELLQQFISPYSNNLDPGKVKSLAKKTEKFSGHDIKTLVTTAGMNQFAETTNFNLDDTKSDLLRPLTMRDFDDALKKTSPTNENKALRELEEWNEKYGTPTTSILDDIREQRERMKKDPLLLKVTSFLQNFFSSQPL